MSKDTIIENVLNLTGKEENDLTRLKIEALINEILSYLNRDNITEDMIPIISTVISDSINILDTGNIQSLREGDMSITFLNNSPFFGKLDSFKLIRGIKKCSDATE